MPPKIVVALAIVAIAGSSSWISFRAGVHSVEHLTQPGRYAFVFRDSGIMRTDSVTGELAVFDVTKTPIAWRTVSGSAVTISEIKP